MIKINEEEKLVEIENIEKMKVLLLQGFNQRFNPEEKFYYKSIIDDGQVRLRCLLDKENFEKVFHLLNKKNEGFTNQKIVFQCLFLMVARRNEMAKEIKLTEDEKVILRNLPERFKWIARDKKGNLFVYCNEPFRREGAWVPVEFDEDEWEHVSIFPHLFQSIKWEDEKSYLIEDLLKM